MSRWFPPLTSVARPVLPRWWPQALTLSLLLALGWTLVVHATLALQAERQLSVLRTQDAALLDSANRLLHHHLREVQAGLRTLAQTPVIQRLAAQPNDPALRAEASRYMQAVVTEAQIYDQLRFIDAHGMEQVRVDLRAHGAVVIPDQELQNKGGRYFFQEAMRLPPGRIYLSPLDLNIEHGQIERPYKPMLRLALPLFGPQGERQGIVIVNVHGGRLIKEFRQLIPPQHEAIWLNAQGDWLLSPDPAQAWGFMFGKPGAFAQAQPELWHQMRGRPHGQLMRADGLWTYATLWPQHAQTRPEGPPSEQDYAWVLATRIPHAALPSARLRDNTPAPLLYLCGLLVLCAATVSLVHLRHSRQRLQAQSQAQRERLVDITNTMAEGLMVLDTKGLITFVNPEAQRMLGWHADEMLGRDAHSLIHHHHPDGSEAPQHACAIQAVPDTGRVYRSENEVFFHKDGHPLSVGVSAAPLLRNAQPDGTVLVFSDLSQLKAYQAEIQQLAFHDALTGLPNRRLLKERLTQALGQAERHQRQVALMYLDLDHFKEINDTLGHDGGDELLQVVATRLKQGLRATDTVARMGGDEFVVLLPEVADQTAAERVAQHLLHTLSAPIQLKGQVWQVGMSIGVALFPDAGDDAGALQQAADQAMYVAKQSGRHRYHVFTPELAQANPNPTPIQPA